MLHIRLKCHVLKSSNWIFYWDKGYNFHSLEIDFLFTFLCKVGHKIGDMHPWEMCQPWIKKIHFIKNKQTSGEWKTKSRLWIDTSKLESKILVWTVNSICVRTEIILAFDGLRYQSDQVYSLNWLGQPLLLGFWGLGYILTWGLSSNLMRQMDS